LSNLEFSSDLPSQLCGRITLPCATRALEPLDRDSGWDEGELPDTYPEGL
jgi:hypothetical protein